MIVSVVKTLIFDNFRFELRPHPHNRDEIILKLYRGAKPAHAERQTLKLLRFLADQHPDEELTTNQICEALWGNDLDPGGALQKQISMLRGVLGDRIKPYRIIATLPEHAGYKFIAEVRAEGDLGRIDGFQKWSNARFFDLISKVTRNEDDTEDLRLLTTAFLSIQDMRFEDLLQNKVRVRIVMVNPENWPLMTARNALRTDDISPEEAQRLGRQQIATLTRMKAKYSAGALDWRLSDAMPCALIAHTRDWALFGIFPAQGSYLTGPMIDVEGGTELWRTLYEDWKLRWDNPAKPAIARKKKR